MAEAVGLAASVLTVAQTGWTVAKGLYELADEVGSAGEAVRIFANDFWLFVEAIKTLGDAFDRLPPASTRIHSTTEELLDVAMEQVVKPFQNMVIQLEPLLIKWRDSPSRIKQLGVRLQWAFKYKSRVLFYHSALNALKGNVSLLLQAMTLRSQNPPHVQFVLCNSIEDTKTALQSGSREQASRLLISKNDGTVNGRLIMPSSEKALESRSMIDTIPSQTSSKVEDRRQLSTETAIIRATDADDLDNADEITECLTGITLLEPDYINSPEQYQEEKEEQLETFGAIRAVQKKVIKLADEATNAATMAPDQRYKTTSSNKLPLRTNAESSAISQQAERTVSQETPCIVPPQKQTDEIAAGRTTEPEVVKGPETIEKGNEMIYLRDSLGSRFEIPYHLVRTWQAMHAFLIAEYGQLTANMLVAHVDSVWEREGPSLVSRIRTAIREGDFTVVHVENETTSRIILIHKWETCVKPGWTLQLHLDDDELDDSKLFGRYENPSFKTIRLAQIAAAKAGSGGRLRKVRQS